MCRLICVCVVCIWHKTGFLMKKLKFEQNFASNELDCGCSWANGLVYHTILNLAQQKWPLILNRVYKLIYQQTMNTIYKNSLNIKNNIRFNQAVILSSTCTTLISRKSRTREPGHENMCHVICEQQRRRSACTSAQSDQRLCCSLLR